MKEISYVFGVFFSAVELRTIFPYTVYNKIEQLFIVPTEIYRVRGVKKDSRERERCETTACREHDVQTGKYTEM